MADTEVAPTTATNGAPTGDASLVDTSHGASQIRGQASVAR